MFKVGDKVTWNWPSDWGLAQAEAEVAGVLGKRVFLKGMKRTFHVDTGFELKPNPGRSEIVLSKEAT